MQVYTLLALVAASSAAAEAILAKRAVFGAELTNSLFLRTEPALYFEKRQDNGGCLTTQSPCNDKCMPLGSVCCGNGRYCNSGYTCVNNGLSCSPGGTNGQCDVTTQDPCTDKCMPKGAVCCGNGRYCNSGDTCTNNGQSCTPGGGQCNSTTQAPCNDKCMPLGGVCCGNGRYCNSGYTCINAGLNCSPPGGLTTSITTPPVTTTPPPFITTTTSSTSTTTTTQTQSPSPTPSPTPVGAIVGGVVGGVAALALIGLLAFFILRQRKKKDEHPQQPLAPGYPPVTEATSPGAGAGQFYDYRSSMVKPPMSPATVSPVYHHPTSPDGTISTSSPGPFYPPGYQGHNIADHSQGPVQQNWYPPPNAHEMPTAKQERDPQEMQG